MTAIVDDTQLSLFGPEAEDREMGEGASDEGAPTNHDEAVDCPPVGDQTAANHQTRDPSSAGHHRSAASEPAEVEAARRAPRPGAHAVTSAAVHPTPDAAPRPQTLEEALQQIATLGLLEPGVLRRVRSDIKVAAQMIALPGALAHRQGENTPADIPCDPERLRPLLNDVRPVRFDREPPRPARFDREPRRWSSMPRRWSSIRSSTTRVLRLTGWLVDGKANRAPLPEPWKSAAEQISQVARHAVFARFARFCLARGIACGDVGAATLEEFRAHRLRSSLDPNVKETIYALRRAWNDLAAASPTWGGQPLTRPQRPNYITKPFSELNPGFVADLEAYLKRLADPDPFDQRVRKAKSPATIKCLRRILRLEASILVMAGWKVDEIRSLRDLVRPKAVEAILRDQWVRVGHNKAWPPGAVSVASYIKMVARHCPEIPDDERAKIEELCSIPKTSRKGLTKKNRDRLTQFDDPQALARFYHLPGGCFVEADRLFSSGKKIRAAQLHQRAIALAILICKPLRKRQLARLDLAHFKKDRRGRFYYFCVPGEETKNGQDNEANLPEPLIRRLAIHLDKYRPLLLPGESTAIFIGCSGGQINDEYLARRVSRLVEDRVGNDFSVHFARHLAATLILDDDPNNAPVAQRLLDHTDVKTTIRYYGAQRTRGSQQVYIRILEEKTAAIRSKRK